MKKAFIAILIFYLVFHFIIPEIYFAFFGPVHIYSELQDQAASNKVFWLNAISVLGTILLLVILPFKNYQVPTAIKSTAATELFYISIAYSVLFLIVAGGFSGFASGAFAGSLFNYASLFLNTGTLLICAIFLQEKKVKIIQMILIFITVMTLSGSRSGVVLLILIFLSGAGFYSFNRYKKGIKRVMVYFLIASPILFVFATQLRNGLSGINLNLLSYLIVGRLSCIELGMIPVHYMDAQSLDFSLFYEKYGFIHQVKLIIDSLIPGDVFGFDVMPNQYYRQIFFGQSEGYVIENYMSINITFPVYLYLFFGYWAVPFTVIFLLAFFYFLYINKRNPYIFLLFIPCLYNILLFFDWVMIFNEFFVSLLTVGTLFVYKLFRNYFVESVKSVSHVN